MHRPALALCLLIGCGNSSPAPNAAPPPAADTSAPSGPLALPHGAEDAARAISENALRDTVAALSDDRFSGRAPGTPGDEQARQWLERELVARGYAPGGEGDSYQQPFEIVGITAKIPKTWAFSGKNGKVSLAWWEQFIAASGVQREEVDVKDAELVFVGYGIVAPEEQWDDFKGADLRGKVLLMINDDPSTDPELFAGERRLYYGRWTYKYESAARQGAAGAIIIHTDASAGYPWRVVQTSWSGEQVELPPGDEPRTPIHGWVTEEAARRLVALGGHELDALVARAQRRDFAPVPLGVKTSMRFECALRRTKTANVLGLLKGSDPSLSDELVVLTAHHDHLGRGEPNESGDRIYNGARDNASGVAQALAVARALAAMPERPRRSILVALVGAEEQGLLGSAYYARRPTFAADRLVANLNFELGNIWGRTEDVVIHGKGKSSLDRLVEAAAARQNRTLRDEADPRSGWYYRSDQLSFARIGVPAMWFESGRDFVGRPEGWGKETVQGWVATHYHQPSDELTDAWRFDGMLEDTRLAFHVALSIASQDERPAWAPGDEFAR